VWVPFRFYNNPIGRIFYFVNNILFELLKTYVLKHLKSNKTKRITTSSYSKNFKELLGFHKRTNNVLGGCLIFSKKLKIVVTYENLNIYIYITRYIFQNQGIGGLRFMKKTKMKEFLVSIILKLQ
jgi:hypothetical protein